MSKIIISGDINDIKAAVTQTVAVAQLLKQLNLTGGYNSDRAFAPPVAPHPKITLYFREDKDKIPAGRTYPHTGEISFRMMDETYKTVTESNLRSLGFKIRDKFGANSGYQWDKGKAIAAYHDWEKGYRFWILVKTQTEAQRIVTDVMGLQGHEPEWLRLNFTENAAPESRYPTEPPTETIAGQSVKMPQLRPRVEVRFTHATAEIHGLIDPIVLYDRTNLQFDPLVDDTSEAPG